MNDPQITVVGNVAAAPDLRTTGSGIAVTDFRVAATPRRLDRATDTWSDGETIWFKVTAWRTLAEHCCASIKKGDRVVVTGSLAASSWQTEKGEWKQSLEVKATNVGMDLTRGNATYLKSSRPVAVPDGVRAGTGEIEPGGGFDRAARLGEEFEPEELPDELDGEPVPVPAAA